ncbi:MAG: DUF58 domain-containing protein [Microbacteriaceae bacterium]|nr:DUF58 domain-containing protein [Microbacteriaceae bacterium]MCL2795119.1 DUF58 domain-containing protein [Microbacteriaceae bacterium]
MSLPDSPPARTAPRWRLGVAQTGALLVGFIACVGGVVAGRADVVVIGLPLLLLAAWAWDRRPLAATGQRATDAAPLAPAAVELTADESAREATLGYRIAIDTPPGVEAVQLRVLELGIRPRTHVLAARPGHPIVVRGRVPAPHSGPQRVVIVDWRFVATGAAVVSDVSEPIPVDRVIDPAFTPIEALPLPHRLTGLTGAHNSSRPGDGGDFHDLALFRPGDRLRRIDWKATARLARDPGELYVRRTQAQADATVFLVIDTGDDVGEEVETWARFDPAASGPTSLDIARSAASAVAAGFVRVGDRVGFTDLGRPARVVPPGAGGRHLDRLLRTIAATGPVGTFHASRRPPLVTQGSAVFLFSTFLDDRAEAAAVRLAASGHRVVAVDVLPPPRTATLSGERRLAHRLVMMQRHSRLGRLRGAGVEVLAWGVARDDVLRDAELLALARPRRTGLAATR